MTARPAFYMGSFLVIFGGIFAYAILTSPSGTGLLSSPPPNSSGRF